MILELEGLGDLTGVLEIVESKALAGIPGAVITNFAPFVSPMGEYMPHAAEPLIEYGLECITEAYLGDNPNATPDRLDFTARKLGWERSQPCFGIYNLPLARYATWFSTPGWSTYLAEYHL